MIRKSSQQETNLRVQPGIGQSSVSWQGISWAKLWDIVCTKIVARKFVQDVGVLTVANVAGAALSFVQGILVARWLGPESFGVAALVMSYPQLVYGFFDARSVSMSVKYLGEYHSLGECGRVLAMCKLSCAVDLGVALLTFVVLVLTAHFAAQSLVPDPAAAGLMILYGAALIPRALVGTSNAVLATLGRFRMIAAIEIAATFLRVVLIIGLVLAGWQVAGVVLANALAAAATGLFYAAPGWVLVRREWGGSIFQGRLRDLKGTRRQIFAFLAYNDLGALVGMIPRQLDTLLLGYFRNPTEVGYYKLAKSISGVAGYLIGPLKVVVYPELTQLWARGQKHTFLQRIRKLMGWIGLPLGVVVLIGAGLLSFVLPFLVGEAYLPAVRATQLLCIGSAISLVFFWTRPAYLAGGRIRQMFIINSTVTVVFALLYPFIVRQWGYMGSSGWMLALQVVGTCVSVSWLWKQLNATELRATEYAPGERSEKEAV